MDKDSEQTQPTAADTTPQGKVYEMLWDCDYCATAKLLGKTHRFCPNCGAGQNPEKRYFPSDEEKIAVEDHVYVGADRLCSSCRVPNSASAEFCGQCGTPLSDAAQAERRSDEVRAESETFAESTPSKAHLPKQPPQKPSRSRPWLKVAGAILLLLVVGLVINHFWTKAHFVAVTGHQWEREIQIETFAARAKDTWCDQTPADAYRISRSSQVRSYRDIPDGETCSTRRIDQGDGTYREVDECRPKYRKEPVYDQYCHFTVDRWGYARSAKASAGDQSPKWPESQLRKTGQCLGCEREGQRMATYTLFLLDPTTQSSYQCNLDLALWQGAAIQSRWSLEIGVLDNAPHCGSLKPESTLQ